jgi:hypothetical protein
MPKRSCPGQLLLASLIGLLVVGGARGDGYIIHQDKYELPSSLEHVVSKPNVEEVQVGCYDIWWGSPINCHFLLWVSYPPATIPPYLANGGHYHDANTRPLIYRQRHFVGNDVYYDGPGSLAFPGDIDPDRQAVAGETFPEADNYPCLPWCGPIPAPYARAVFVEWPVPEVSGEVQIDTQLFMPPPYAYCVAECYAAREQWRRTIYHVGVQGLKEVPDPGASDHYIKVRSKDASHPNAVAFNIKPEHLSQLRKIADKYYQAFANDASYQNEHGVQRPLSLNDMTLPFGGLFDVYHNWAPPHRSHRDGTDVDLNRIVNNVTIECSNNDKHLIKIVQRVLPNVPPHPSTNSALLCEHVKRKDGTSFYKYHIDFE